jgi:hypothetical protein
MIPCASGYWSGSEHSTRGNILPRRSEVPRTNDTAEPAHQADQVQAHPGGQKQHQPLRIPARSVGRSYRVIGPTLPRVDRKGKPRPCVKNARILLANSPEPSPSWNLGKIDASCKGPLTGPRGSTRIRQQDPPVLGTATRSGASLLRKSSMAVPIPVPVSTSRAVASPTSSGADRPRRCFLARLLREGLLSHSGSAHPLWGCCVCCVPLAARPLFLVCHFHHRPPFFIVCHLCHPATPHLLFHLLAGAGRADRTGQNTGSA